jgi:hypothetical protein
MSGGRVKDRTATTSFATTHRDEAESPHKHGHTFFVTVIELGEPTTLQSSLEDVAQEIHLHDLDEMLGVPQTLDSLAMWFMERLLINHPRIKRTEIWVADRPEVHIGVSREVR